MKVHATFLLVTAISLVCPCFFFALLPLLRIFPRGRLEPQLTDSSRSSNSSIICRNSNRSISARRTESLSAYPNLKRLEWNQILSRGIIFEGYDLG
ncbi:hypothetical protein IW261DRAFT_1063207 [Armillaria novae-zelandiae]|uniref:Uncharacterized protein n=1 Tax=Armillaria novae-zelandiae TaxID=153914 RepID=A0AA39TQZ1_9AGAR|nr:hypothetical protein IW261DRAFT_1063207 [Armillaria novae-zelandiae]